MAWRVETTSDEEGPSYLGQMGMTPTLDITGMMEESRGASPDWLKTKEGNADLQSLFSKIQAIGI